MSLEIKKLRVEILKCQMNAADMDVKIDEQMKNIQRMRDHMKLQTEREKEIKAQIKELEKGEDNG